jgi:hypothetical protein
MDKLIEQALLENKIVRYIPTFVKVLKTYKSLLDEAEQQLKTCNKPAVITCSECGNTFQRKEIIIQGDIDTCDDCLCPE